MTTLLKKAKINGGAQALRRYVTARADGREFGEWAKYVPDIRAWVFCTEAEAKAEGEIPSHRIRVDSMPWCPWLGRDTRITDDIALQAFFEAHVTEDFGGWSPLRSQVQRSPTQTYLKWRRIGRRLLDIAKAQREQTEIPPGSGPSLADEFAEPGKGLHDIPCAKRD